LLALHGFCFSLFKLSQLLQFFREDFHGSCYGNHPSNLSLGISTKLSHKKEQQDEHDMYLNAGDKIISQCKQP
jgi:hypothetical protein